MTVNAFPRVPRPKCLPGKEMGVHAGNDAEGELVYIGMDNIKMHRYAFDRVNKKWDEAFGKFDKLRKGTRVVVTGRPVRGVIADILYGVVMIYFDDGSGPHLYPAEEVTAI